ncbi:MAG TPA: porin family protein [Bacteroidales bacterium]|nr:porin family protein [Bacteroidales bacterium]
MKKILITLSVLILSFVSLQAQDTNENSYDTSSTSGLSYHPRHEIRANVLMSVIGMLTFDYEYFVDNNFGLGLSGSYSLEKKSDVLQALLLPYGRLYFGSRVNDGFFIEGNAGMVSQKFETYNNNIEYKQYFGLGVGAGYKFLTRNNWVGELELGVGRTFGKEQVIYYSRVGISIGKRF